jgi:hypothetical protein
MTHAPSAYSPFPGEPLGEQKTSIMAIVALVCSLICFVPGLSIVGVLLAVVALLMISGSNGRLGGRGIAIAALIIGLIVSAIWITIGIGAMQVSKAMSGEFTQPLSQLMTDIDSKDYAKARQSLTPAAAAAITDEDFTRFVEGYQSELGAFQHGPKGFGDLIQSYGKLGQQMQQFQGGQGNVIPFPGMFANGLSVIAFQVDQQGGPGTQIKIPLSNIMVITPSGKKVTLYDPAANATSPMSMPQPPKTGDTPPADAPAPGG